MWIQQQQHIHCFCSGNSGARKWFMVFWRPKTPLLAYVFHLFNMYLFLAQVHRYTCFWHSLYYLLSWNVKCCILDKKCTPCMNTGHDAINNDLYATYFWRVRMLFRLSWYLPHHCRTSNLTSYRWVHAHSAFVAAPAPGSSTVSRWVPLFIFIFIFYY